MEAHDDKHAQFRFPLAGSGNMQQTIPQAQNDRLDSSKAAVSISNEFRLAPQNGSTHVLPRIPLIEDMTTAPIPAGTALLVEYDAASQWYNASLTIAAGWLKSGGKVSFGVATQPADNIREQLRKLGVNPVEFERDHRLEIDDWFTATYKAADLSLAAMEPVMGISPDQNRLQIQDDISIMSRFNDERSWVEVMLSRLIPRRKIRNITSIYGIITGVHSDWVYKRLEAAVEGIVDFKLEEENAGITRDVVRIRNIRNVGFKRGWHQLKIGDDFEVRVES